MRKEGILMKRLLLSVVAAAMLATSAVADYTFVVPQRAGQGTTVWAEIIAKELEPLYNFLGFKVGAIVGDIKEKHCYVAMDYKKEL